MNKYKRYKIIVDNILFDSKLESRAYLVLKKLQEENIIQNLELQQEYLLIPSFECCKQKFRSMKYFADFTFDIKGEHYVIDTKGVVTKDFKLKQKLMGYINNIRVLIFYKENELEEWCKEVYDRGFQEPPEKTKKKRKAK